MVATSVPFNSGLCLIINKDSAILSSELHLALNNILKSSSFITCLQDKACSLILEKLGWVIRVPVLYETPLCSQIRIFRFRKDDPIYLDLQSGQLKEYTIFEQNGTGIESLQLKNEPIVFLLIKMNLNWTSGMCFLNKADRVLRNW